MKSLIITLIILCMAVGGGTIIYLERQKAPVSHAVDSLVSAQTSYSKRWTLLRQLKNTGKLDLVIAELKQRAASQPNDAQIPTVLGEAYLNKFPVRDNNESAILGLEVDQSFNTALQLDPTNWEAQFFKADAMSYWPAELNKGPEVIQRLTSLIDQQRTMPPQPQFVRTYVLLGDQYQKAGQADQALQTWRLGAQQFPNDPVLKKRIANP